MKQISLLLGAGFSVNKGYPTSAILNKKILELNSNDFCVSTAGAVAWLSQNQDDPFWYSSYYISKLFTLELIKFYAEKYEFDYEEFYDFYKQDAKDEKKNADFKVFCDDFREKYHIETDNINLLRELDNIFNQIIIGLLVDYEGKKFYDPEHCCGPIYPGYTGFLNCLRFWGKEYKVNIHTLNHDLFFETFKSSDWIMGELADGFQELGSPYYGDFQERFKVRLPYFANKYDKKFCLYKLHGSIDQFPFHIQNFGIDTYIKIKPGIGTDGLYKEVKNESNEFEYINDWINYHSDFLSGTTSKILRYKEPWYYEKVFQHFENNLSNSDKLILVGYGCRDVEINNLIGKHFKKENALFVVDPYPHEKTLEFCKKFNAQLIQKGIEQLSIKDLAK